MKLVLVCIQSNLVNPDICYFGQNFLTINYQLEKIRCNPEKLIHKKAWNKIIEESIVNCWQNCK